MPGKKEFDPLQLESHWFDKGIFHKHYETIRFMYAKYQSGNSRDEKFDKKPRKVKQASGFVKQRPNGEFPEWAHWYLQAIEHGANKECAASEAGVTVRQADYERETNLAFREEVMRRRSILNEGIVAERAIELTYLCREYGLFYSLGYTTMRCIEVAPEQERTRCEIYD